ncbi:hypothetical protein Acr_15g0006590 [Actinidia rufa]|uniref:ATP-dependent Clp protease proteolytic subunit n=1 Tax=Actinidia rufa TaxID=165716 RepID=A0A7J0FV36_9ERIC|nr:hypothetical protein Acr_15g0006590 [Actinidia rufa]
MTLSPWLSSLAWSPSLTLSKWPFALLLPSEAKLHHPQWMQILHRMVGVELYAEAIGKTPEQIEADIRWPKYFSPTEAVEYGIIDRVLYNEKARKDRGAFSDQKKAEQQA